ncbi:MAG TPA: helix-hairpin-helix domain-containing protein, partial [Candidatus Limnocylindrales bacterium]|nr:helix-hairpin-helix domain-containing protein [Candidatus Limnocylindrales bacterium]
MPRDHTGPATATDPASDPPIALDPATASPTTPDPATAETLTNGDLARVFHKIGDMLEVQGELVFKTVAYHRAADALAHSPIDVPDAYRRGERPRIPGVGQAISDKIADLVATGHMRLYDRLRAEVPPSLVEMLQVPGLGPKTVKLVYESLGVKTLEDLRAAAQAGRLRTVKGLSEKTEQTVLEGIAGLAARQDRMLLGQAQRIVDLLTVELRDASGLRSIQPAGSFRRRRETIGDLDLLAETTEPAILIDRFTRLGSVDLVVNRGRQKAVVRLLRGPQVDLMVMPPGQAGTYLIHFTGSKAHNVRLRARARDRGWSLSEKGFQRIGEDGEPLTGPSAELRTFATEAEAYAFLELPFIEPDLREDRGEIEAALAGRLPRLIELGDLRGDLHSHSDWSDGVHSIEQMAETARRRGHAYQVLTDHSQSLAIARGLSPERVALQRGVIAALNERYASEEAAGTAPSGTPKEGFRLLHGCELEIRADGRLDFPDDLLASFDLVVASLHVARRQSRRELTARV